MTGRAGGPAGSRFQLNSRGQGRFRLDALQLLIGEHPGTEQEANALGGVCDQYTYWSAPNAFVHQALSM